MCRSNPLRFAGRLSRIRCRLSMTLATASGASALLEGLSATWPDFRSAGAFAVFCADDFLAGDFFAATDFIAAPFAARALAPSPLAASLFAAGVTLAARLR